VNVTRLRNGLLGFLFGPIGSLVPFAACRRIAAPVAAIAWRFGFRREITMRNLELAFPDMEPRERERIGRRSLHSLATVFLEIITLRHLSSPAIRRHLAIENIELLRSIGPEGALLLSGHVGNWELLAIGAAEIAGIPFAVIVKEQSDGRQLERTRTSRGNRLIPTGRGAREASMMLRTGGVVAMLADQSAVEGEHRVDMFGIPTYTYSAPARLALRFRPKVITGFAVRQENGAYRVELSELPHHDLPDTPEGAEAFTARYVAALERVVRQHPEQWVWQHRKWKNTPGVRYE
jgi:Kdo2-lipid IVA lauroyltransferase/acyltransferase